MTNRKTRTKTKKIVNEGLQILTGTKLLSYTMDSTTLNLFETNLMHGKDLEATKLDSRRNHYLLLVLDLIRMKMWRQLQ